MTLQEAKDQIAKNHGHEAWRSRIYENSEFKMDAIWRDVAELYARSKWDEACEAQKAAIGRAAFFKEKPEFKP